MFTALSERLTATLKRLTGRGVLSEQDVTEALREIRRHLLEADVSFEVTTGFGERYRPRSGPAGGSRGGESSVPHRHRRHGRPVADRRGPDGRAQGAAGGDEPARGPAGRGWDDGAGRRADRPRLS